MIAPYYDHAGITIFHGDCREILPQLGPVDLVLTDPPYGISYSPGDGGRGWTKGIKTFSGNDLVFGDDEPFNPAFLLNFPEIILWGANHYSQRLPSRSSWLVWDKRQDGLTNDFADCEMAWWSKGGPARIFHHLWCGAFRASERKEKRVHPTQKPILLMRWCLSLSLNSHMVLDPFVGSGTTLIAAKQLGRKAIGIEIEEKYCAIAVKRLAQEVFDFEERPVPVDPCQPMDLFQGPGLADPDR